MRQGIVNYYDIRNLLRPIPRSVHRRPEYPAHCRRTLPCYRLIHIIDHRLYEGVEFPSPDRHVVYLCRHCLNVPYRHMGMASVEVGRLCPPRKSVRQLIKN